MSRIGKLPISLPAGVEVKKEDRRVTVTGPKGSLTLQLLPEVEVEVQDSNLVVKRKSDEKKAKAIHGLTRSLLNNMVIGVSSGWSKQLELVGVGYRASGGGDTLTLQVGYSHPVVIKAPAGIQFSVAENTKITVSGIDKELVGQVAASIRAVRPPEPYKGKGIRYLGEHIRLKPGKAGKAGGK